MILFKGLNKVASYLYSYLNALLLCSVIITLQACNTQASMTAPKNIHADSEANLPIYNALLGELYLQFGEEKSAVDHYQQVARQSEDAAVSKRATELATTTGQLKKALSAAKRWVELAPLDLEARQYLALLHLRNNQFEHSAKHIDKVYILVKNAKNETTNTKEEVGGSKSSEIKSNNDALSFIGTLLAAESHHDKAFEVFNLFLKNHAKNESEVQQNVIAASLALKAKKYNKVVSLLANISALNNQNLVDVTTMKAKALSKLDKTKQAIKLLQPIVAMSEANDSTRLELVRLLVQDKQKNKALEILKKLAEKHKHNYELLKSLIALQIDQLELDDASINIDKLYLSASYKFDAEYLRGEVLEAQGLFEQALKSYEKVSGGTFLGNARKKTISLTRQLRGLSAAHSLIRLQQTKAKKSRVKAYWYKQEADLYFDLNENESALSLYSKAIDLSPENTVFRYHRGLLNVRIGAIKLAEKDFNFILKNKKDDVDALNALGYMLTVHTTRLSEAKVFIEKAHKLEPNDPVIQDSLGWLYFKMGDFSSAENYLLKAFDSIKTPEVASHLISALLKAEKHQQARNIYNEIYKKYPNNKKLNNVKQSLPEI